MFSNTVNKAAGAMIISKVATGQLQAHYQDSQGLRAYTLAHWFQAELRIGMDWSDVAS